MPKFIIPFNSSTGTTEIGTIIFSSSFLGVKKSFIASTTPFFSCFSGSIFIGSLIVSEGITTGAVTEGSVFISCLFSFFGKIKRFFILSFIPFSSTFFGSIISSTGTAIGDSIFVSGIAGTFFSSSFFVICLNKFSIISFIPIFSIISFELIGNGIA